ncbi:MAG: rod shape-determining protein RodA [bacterium]|nr:rod shape-determining protein RodA [bacterium]
MNNYININKIRNVDFILVIATIVLVSIGILIIFSISYQNGINKVNLFWKKQCIYSLIGFVCMIIISCLNYEVIRKYSFIIYSINIVFLVLVLLYASPIRHVHSWFCIGGFSFQPSEIAKLSTILMLANYLSRESEKLKKNVNIFYVFIIVLIPLFLISKQPDLGTAVLFFPVMFIMLYVNGIKKDYLLAIVIISFMVVLFTIICAIVEFKPKYEITLFENVLTLIKSKKTIFIVVLIMSFITVLNKLFKNTVLRFNLRKTFIYYLSFIGGAVIPVLMFNFLKSYQKKRLFVFLDPNIDPLGAGYNIIQSKIAIGSGKIFGKGFLSGTQSQLGFLPEQQTDFVFSVIGEEFGLAGLLTVILLFVIIIYRGLYLTYLAKNNFDFLIGIGIVSLIGTQMLISMGVATGIMPVTGLPLPFVSYGGSSLCTFMLGIGILLGIKNQNH